MDVSRDGGGGRAYWAALVDSCVCVCVCVYVCVCVCEGGDERMWE